MPNRSSKRSIKNPESTGDAKMNGIMLRDIFPKKQFEKDFVEKRQAQIRKSPGVLACDLDEDDTNYVLTTTYPDPNETDPAVAAATPVLVAAPAGNVLVTTDRSFPTPQDATGLAIDTWEGLWQANPADSGNYAHCPDGSTRLVGTMRGITPDAFARFHEINPCNVTADMLKNSVSLKVAVDIAMKNYFNANKFDQLLWSPVVDAAFDAALLSGPGRSIKMVQQLVGANADGAIGPQTAEALELFLESHDLANVCNQFADIRIGFYKSISEPGTKNAQFRQGWINRANWARPSNNDWWIRWAGWKMPHPAGSTKATGTVMAANIAPSALAPAAPSLEYIAANPEQWLGQAVGSGQCVAYVQAASGAPHTSRWRRGMLVKDNFPLQQGTAIATFDPNGTYGNHTDGRSHAAIYLGQDQQGLSVIDQWLGQPVHRRVIRFGGTAPVNDGNMFYVIG